MILPKFSFPKITLPKFNLREIPRVWRLRLRLLLNVFIDTLVISIFPIIMFSSLAITNLSFLDYRGDTVPEIMRTHILATFVYNALGIMESAFAITFLGVFIKHTSNSTADKSREILNKINQTNARDN